MGITNSNKELSTTHINCGESFKIKLSLAAEPDISSNPSDIVLILDRSQSMAGSPLANLKSGAKKFIDIIDDSTDGTQDGHIGFGSHIGIVSFSSVATQDTGLITSVAELKAAVDALSSGGRTNHADAFTKAVELFNPMSANSKVIVMFTDGETTVGGNANPLADEAKEAGIVIYCIGLSGNGGIDENALNDWASDPDSAYVAITPDDAELESIFENLAKNISKPGATDIEIKDIVDDCFKITSLSPPSKGTAALLTPTTLQWKIEELGVRGSEGAFLEFTVQHVGACSGEIDVNKEITYHDHEGNSVVFPMPPIDIDCSLSFCSEFCPEQINIQFEGCQDTLDFDAGTINLDSLGRILELTVTIRNVCPNKRVALAVILTEIDIHGIEHRRGIKFVTVPEHFQPGCRDVTVRCIRFVLPEDIDETGQPTSLCNPRRFKVRFLANYIDSGFDCSNEII